MAKVAFATWDERIAPVFDTAQELIVVEAEGERVLRQARETLGVDLPVGRALRLRELGVRTLVCGAISNLLHVVLASYGIRVVPFIAGNHREVVQAWLAGGFDRGALAMPGCCSRIEDTRGDNKEDLSMRGRGYGRGPGGRRGRGRRGQPSADEVRSDTAGSPSYCLCAECGQRVPHERGAPCRTLRCPKCGGVMARE